MDCFADDLEAGSNRRVAEVVGLYGVKKFQRDGRTRQAAPGECGLPDLVRAAPGKTLSLVGTTNRTAQACREGGHGRRSPYYA